jgi:hypothetical protein
VEDSRNGERIVFYLGEECVGVSFHALRECLTTDPSYSILVLNHDWRPDKVYNLSDSWVGKIIDIRGNAPRNVRSSRPERKLVLTGHHAKTWVIVQWYFSGKDIEEHELGKSDRLRVYVSTAPQSLSTVKLQDQGRIILRHV